MLCGSRTSEMLSCTRSRMSAMLRRLPPYSGISESTRNTFAPSATSRRASAEPMKPAPPVMSTLLPEKGMALVGRAPGDDEIVEVELGLRGAAAHQRPAGERERPGHERAHQQAQRQRPAVHAMVRPVGKQGEDRRDAADQLLL